MSLRFSKSSRETPLVAGAVGCPCPKTPRPRRSIVADLVRDRRGATAVEFGLIAAPALFSLCAVLAIGMNFFMVAALDRATLKAARSLATGSVSPSGMSASVFQQQTVCPLLPSLFTCSSVFVSVKTLTAGQTPSSYYGLVNAARSGLTLPPLDASQDTFCPGAGSQYVVVQVLYPAPIWAAFLAPATATTYNGQSVRVLMSSTTFKSEPYTGATTYQGC